MNIKFFSAKELNIDKMKCTVHKSGRLGFNDEARKGLDLNENTFIMIGRNEDPNDKNLYMKVLREQNDAAFKVNKNGDYYNINIKALFELEHIDYTNTEKTIMFYIQEMYIGEDKYYKLKMKERERKKDGGEIQEEEAI